MSRPAPLNFRDLGGLPTVEGGRVRSGALYRSATPVFLGPDEAEVFRAATGIRIRIDLRGRREIAETSERDRLTSGLRVMHLPFGRSSLRPVHPDPSVRLAEHYADMLVVSARTIIAAVRHAVDARDHPLLVHCTAGKDRTGVVVAVLLAALGVRPGDVIEDYARSREHLVAIRNQTRVLPAWEKRIASLPEEAHTAEPATMRHFLARVEQRHGGVANWLTTEGFGADEITALRAGLVEH
ncbi:tyrosine-protein phosphatase [Micromonospora sp. WMMD1128]|uniref:tyrosine-protein phosphatase n=1 Tax=unclassified Micromonospora TaxID=2617518 RepID=UPI00248C5F38|nr:MULTISPECIES: tyrosine-protein phosphatase [unclassified Micromonospora]WBB75772.1 tyrosine-protein phosphatase [Micromonospora sp. WMMD1128]WFE36438.1 tyrosine-protein phosphatase [Micromonospora sp. WMMD975]